MATTEQTSTGTVDRDVEQTPRAGDEFIHHDHIGHGSTPAAWALSGIVILASLLAGIGVIGLSWSNAWLVPIWIGVALIPAAFAVGILMKRMGYGVEMDSDSVLKRADNPRDHSGPADRART